MNERTPPPRWTVYARGEREHDRIARCPGGHIHLDYGNLTVRFQDDEFIAFALLIAKAAARVGGATRLQLLLALDDSESPATYSLN